MIENCADLKLHPALFDKERRKNWWTPRYELETSCVTAWMDQRGGLCPECGKEMKRRGQPVEMPVLDYIIPPKEGGTKKLGNVRVVCFGCAA